MDLHNAQCYYAVYTAYHEATKVINDTIRNNSTKPETKKKNYQITNLVLNPTNQSTTSTWSITLNPSDITPSINIQFKNLRRVANVEGNRKMPTYSNS